ncbi:hypothetical protein [Streptomyces lateritius]|uniref:hypothetical protein n=1 Tax=Streptomyces lateritius TaxID=67313 RepID=UPI00167513BB|nr:hypothetical protein [Streptomyces lateritius]GGU14339.1 hypothetical protein GCM10010272_69210 [Streptomyces lateritius]
MNESDAPDPGEAQSAPGPLLLTFLVALPFPCALPHGAVITKTLPGAVDGLEAAEMVVSQDGPAVSPVAQGRPFVSLKFRQLKERQNAGPMHLKALTQVCAEITGKPLPEEDFVDGTVEAYRTVVEMVTIQSADRLEPQEEALHEAFIRCFEVLTDVSSMAKLVLPHSHPVAAPEQIAVALWLARSLTGSYADGWMGVMPLTPPPGPLGSVLDDDEMTRLNAHLHRFWDGSPMELAMERSTEARRAFRREGDYRNAVVQAAMFAEIVLTSTLALMLWEEQLDTPSVDEAAAVFDFSRGGGLATRVKTEYAPRLGGTWDSTRPGPIHDWAHAVAALRNRVVHRGYRPTHQETETALAAADALLVFIKTRLAQRVARYPRTALLTLGEPGLRRIGGWSRANAYLQNPQQVPDLWFAEFTAWREAVDRRLS